MYDDSLKIIIFGDNFPEKTALTQKFLANLFVSDQKLTIGVDFEVKSLTVDGQKVKLQIWEIGGEERFRFLLPTYLKGTDGGLFVYDITNYSSIAHIDDWLSVIRKKIRAEDMFPILVVGIIPDEECERQVSGEEGKKIAKSRNLNGFIECNIKTRENVEKAFEALTRLILGDSKYNIKKEKISTEHSSKIDFKLKKRYKKYSPKLSSKQPLPPPEPPEAQRPKSPVSLKEAIMREVKRLFSKQVKPEHRILDFESEKVKNLMKQYEEETTKYALWRGAITKSFIKWLKGEEVETRDARLKRERIESLKRKQEDIKHSLQVIEKSIIARENVNEALEILAKNHENYTKDLEIFLKNMKNWEDYNEVKYPYSDILKLFSGDNEYRKRFLMKIRRWRDDDKDRYPYPYVFNPPESPDDLALAPRVQLHASPKKKDPEEKIICQFCGRELTKEEHLNHSCKKKPE